MVSLIPGTFLGNNMPAKIPANPAPMTTTFNSLGSSMNRFKILIFGTSYGLGMVAEAGDVELAPAPGLGEARAVAGGVGRSTVAILQK